ncbi:unnamed protein product [Orchesella dallaii]|uniref:Ropporin-1-like protein n=1 Tax=Orchesella dallaii TaxID=48710 RepID=A0ABP1QQM7_9HEXA
MEPTTTTETGTGTPPTPPPPPHTEDHGGQLMDIFCQDQIRIPPSLPNILKQFTKAAIRTQPRDLDVWGAAYFRAMAEGLAPPVKETLEYPLMESKDGLTVGLLRVLDRQVRKKKEQII